MRILFISNFYPPYELGGYGQWCQEVTIGLRGYGHQIKVLTSRHGIQEKREDNDDITRSLYLQADMYHYRPTDFFLKHRRHERSNLQELRNAIDHFQPDLIMVWGMWNLSLAIPYWAEKWLPGRVVYYIGSYWPIDQDIHSAYWNLPARRPITQLIKRLFRTFALSQLQREGYPPQLEFEHALCCSKYVRDKLVGAGKLPPQAKVLYGGTDPEPFLSKDGDRQYEESPLKLVYFGRLIHDKGVYTAIEAVGQLKLRGLADCVELVILGDGHPSYEEYLHRLVRQFNIDKQVYFVGRVSRDEIAQRLKRYDVFLFTSIWPEPFGMTIIEAMLAGLVVIGSNTGGSREIFEQYDQELLFQAEDAQGLADRICYVLKNPSLRRHLTETGKQIALEKFTSEQMSQNIETYLSQVLAGVEI
jgi:glycogen synthase